MAAPFRRLALLLLLALVPGARLPAQLNPHTIPRRPRLAAAADTNSAVEYFYYGLGQLSKEPERAAAAFYWASRIDPYWADPLYGRYVALLMAQPYNLINAYITLKPEDQHEPRLRAIDSLKYRALLRDPWINRRMEHSLILTWLQTETQGEQIPRYLRDQYPALGAWMSYTEGKFEEAAAQYAIAIAKDPDNRTWPLERARAFVALGQDDSAETVVRAAVLAFRLADADTLNLFYVGYPFLEYSLATLFERSDQLDSAQAAYGRALLDDLTFSPAHRRLASLRLRTGDTTGALAEFAQAVDLAPNDAVTLYDYAILAFATGQPDSVETMLRRATAAEPFFVAPHLALARLYDLSGYPAEAIVEYRAFLRLAPHTLAAQVAAVRARLTQLGAAPSAP